jgi:hypothetical protein
MKLVRIIACALPPLLAGPAFAQAPATLGDAAKALIGTWEFSNAGRDKTCNVTFKSDSVPLGFKLEFEPKCGDLFPLVRGVTAWKLTDNDLLYLLDAQGRSLVEFSEVESGIYEAPTPGVGVLFLQQATAAGPPPKPPEQMAGNWAIRRGPDKVLCSLTLANTPLRDDLALTVTPGCDAAIVRVGFTQWRMDRGELVLVSPRGISWRFEEVDATTWRRLPESADQITLVRQ